jgi:hypothetical protein
VHYETEIRKLAGETLALQTLLVSLCTRLFSRDPSLRPVISDAFDQAASFLEDLTIKAGKTVPPEHLAHSLRIIEELRAATLGDQSQPKHGV